MNARRIDSAYVAGFFAFLITSAISHLRATPYDNYVLLAQAWLHGHSWIDWPGAYIDALGYNGQHYVIEAPLPAVLAIPLVALFGTSANQTIVVAVLASVAVGAAWRLGERFGLNAESNAWICAFLLAGTDLLDRLRGRCPKWFRRCDRMATSDRWIRRSTYSCGHPLDVV
ncbi:MAG TPA: hypothetical protein VN936_04690 [Candidatus Acidoferrum sp.]|nr:hypothetical protein [Candidatus Acidoferrum sp.]